MANQSALVLRTNPLLLLLLLLVCATDAKIEIIIGDVDKLVGQEIIMLCKAGAEADITWQKDGEDIEPESGDEMTSKLVIKKATLEDAGKYTCLCDFDSGFKDENQITLFVHEGPSFGGTKVYHEFLEGRDGVVPCLAKGKPVVDVEWLRNNQKIPSDGRVRQMPDKSLFFKEVSREDAGAYTCVAWISGRPISKNLSVSVVVNVPPTVLLKEEVKKVMAETNVTFLCLVNGLPHPNITWTLPVTFDPSHHLFNSDQSQLTITSVAREDYGEYVCTATNKLAESSGTAMLHVFEAPEVSISSERQRVLVGEPVSVSCNISGHPKPELYWLNKHNGKTVDSTSGRVHVVDGVLTIEEVVPSDGGLYSCMAVSATGNASRDVAIYTQPGPPHYLSVAPGPTSVLFFLKTPPVSGGADINNYVLQWRQNAAEQWKEILTSSDLDPLVISFLKPYTLYTVRLAAMNAVGRGQFSETNTVRTHGIREPDSPILSPNEMKIEANSFSVPLKPTDDGGTPLQHFNIRYKQDKAGAEWKEMQLPSSVNSVSLQGLSFASDYQMEVTAVNANGSSTPAMFNFTIGAQPATSRSMTKGAVVAVVMMIFLVVFLLVDASCCYFNRCGLLMTIAAKLFGQKVPGLRMLEDGEGTTNGEVKLKGISTPRGSLQQGGVQTITKEGGQLTEVTHDKAPLTKNEKSQPRKDLHANDA